MPSYDKSPPVVPVAAIYGANASGKSNLIDALRFMKHAVRDSAGRWEPESGIPRMPFRLDVSALAETSTFTVDLIIDGVQFAYGFVTDDVRVVDEWLYAYQASNRKTVLFERAGLSVNLGDSIPERKSRTKILEGSLRDNSLLLSLAMQLGKQPEFAPVFRWFDRGLLVPRHDPRFTRTVLARRIETALSHSASFVTLAQVADLDLRDIQIERVEQARPSYVEKALAQIDDEISRLRSASEHSDETGAMISRLEIRRRSLERPSSKPELVFLQGRDRTPMTVDDQSDGTVAYLDLVAYAIDALDRGAVLVVDEIDMSLHPRLTARLIELFRDPQANPFRAQLIFTTHDATLLGTSFGEEILRRDEIWFVEKRDGQTALYPLTDFHPRQGENREKRYLGGSYGAVPAVFSGTLADSARAEPADATP